MIKYIIWKQIGCAFVQIVIHSNGSEYCRF